MTLTPLITNGDLDFASTSLTSEDAYGYAAYFTMADTTVLIANGG